VYDWYDSMASELMVAASRALQLMMYPLPNAGVDLSGCFFLSNLLSRLLRFALRLSIILFALYRQLFAEAVYLYVENSFLRGVHE
jgi:hypothetical protein